MKYYKAIDDKDMIFADRTKGLAFVKDELFTEKELKAYCERNRWNFNIIVEHYFTPVVISSEQICRFFGSRFA